MKFDSSSACPFWPLSLLLQLPYQSDPGVSAGKRSAGRGGRQREAEPDQAGGVHQLPGGLSDHAEERIRHPWSQGSLRLLAEPKQNMLADWLPLLWIALNLHLNHLLFALSNIHCNAPRQSSPCFKFTRGPAKAWKNNGIINYYQRSSWAQYEIAELISLHACNVSSLRVLLGLFQDGVRLLFCVFLDRFGRVVH